MTDGGTTAGARARTLVELGLRLALGGLLIVAGLLKLRAPAAFAGEIANYQLVPALAPALGATLPAIEIVVGVALLASPAAWRRAAAAVALALFVTFTLAVGSAYFRDINIACGCFGGGGGTITALTLVRNLALLAGTVALLATTPVGRRGRP